MVSTAKVDDANPLGSLAGRGHQFAKNSGRMRIGRCQEAFGSMITGVAVITPVVAYSQGNKWINDLKTFADIHSPAYDGIAWQDLLTDEMHAIDTTVESDGTVNYKSAGKQIAYQEYMTNVSQAYGDFAVGEPFDWMAMLREYHLDAERDIEDLTTYIDPRIFNRIFANAKLTAMNFWVMLGIRIKTRRKLKITIPHF